MVTGSNSSGPQPPHVTLVPASVDEQPPEALEDLEMALPSPQTFFLGGLFALSLFVVLYLASSIFLPIVLAFVLKLLLQPAVRLFERLYVPRPVGALVAIMLIPAWHIYGPTAMWSANPSRPSTVEFGLSTYGLIVYAGFSSRDGRRWSTAP